MDSQANHLGILLTARCNLKCKHCLQYRHFKQDIDVNLCRKILYDAANIGISAISFSGGEPSLYPYLNEVIETCKENEQEYSITSNGILHKPLLLAANIKPPAHISLSFDGINRSTHESIRGAGTYLKTLQTSRLLVTAGIRVRLQCTLLNSLLSELDSTDTLLTETGADELVIVLPFETKALVRSNNIPNQNEYFNIKKWIKEKRAMGKAISLAFGDEIISTHRNSEISPCKYLRGESIFIDWMGRACLCCQTSGVSTDEHGVICNLSNSTFSQFIKHKEHWMSVFLQLRKQDTSASACADCSKALLKYSGCMPVFNG